MTDCPVCGDGMEMPSEIIMSELLDCDGCQSELEVVQLDPVRLQEAPMAVEDWGE